MKKRILAALLAIFALTASSCGAAVPFDGFDKAMSESITADAGAVMRPSAAGSSKVMYDSVMEEAEYEVSDSSAPLEGRKVIRTMHITAETKNFDAATVGFEKLCASLGGYIESSSRSGGSIRYSNSIVARSANYTFRIPSESLDAFRAGLGSDVNVVNESSNISDITDQYFDVDTRIATLKVEEERLLSMLEKATELEYLITLEKRLSEVRYEIESYTSTLRRYDSQVSYSTVHLNLQEVIEYTEVVEAPKSFGERMGMAFKESWADFVDNCGDFAIMFVYALPTLLTLAVITAVTVAVILIIIRRATRRRDK